MDNLTLIAGGALLVGVLTGPLYVALAWICSVPALPAAGGRRVERAFWAALGRVALGVASAPFFWMFTTSPRGGGLDWVLPAVYGIARVVFWLVVVLVVYRRSPFHSRGHRFAFVIGVTLLGSLLNIGLDHVLFGGSLLGPEGRWSHC